MLSFSLRSPMHSPFRSLVVAALFFAPSATADDEMPQAPAAQAPMTAEEAASAVAALEEKVAQHRTDKDERGLMNDLVEIAEVHPRVVEKDAKDALNDLLGEILEATKTETVKKAAFKAIGDIGDPDNWKHIRSYVRQPDPKSGPPLLKEAIECAGRIKADSAVNPLLSIVAKSKVYAFAGAAITALGNFGDAKRLRVRILGTLVDEVRRSVPSSGGNRPKSGQSSVDPTKYGSTRGGGSGDASRWAALAPLFVAAANKMTGKNAGTPEDWFEIYDRSKGREEALFER